MRLKIIFTTCCICILIIIGMYRIIYISQIQYQYNNIRIEKCGAILDRNDIPLASTIETYSIYMTDKISLDNLIKVINILNIENKEYLFKRHGKKFTWIAHKVNRDMMLKIKHIPYIGFHKVYIRFYPYENLFSHIIGTRNHERKGILGLEQYVDLYSIIRTTLDVQTQTCLHSALSKYINEFNADGAFGILLNHNSEIESLVSLPDFNANQPTAENQFNKIVHGLYEFGSVMKIITFALGIENNIDFNREYHLPNIFKIDKFYIKDVYHHNILTFQEAFQKSSNITSAMIVKDIGKEKHYDFLKKIGLFDQLYIHGIKSKKTYISHLTSVLSQSLSYGYGISFTPLQIIYALSNILHGYKMNPSLIKDTIQDKEEIYKYSDKMHSLMSSRDKVHGLLGMKTGTSKIVINGKYSDKHHIVSCFAMIGNKSNPKYLLIGLINPEAQNNRVLSIQYTYPVIKEFINKAYPILWK